MTSEINGVSLLDNSDTRLLSQTQAALSWFTPSVGSMAGYGVGAIGLIEALMNKNIYVGYNHPKAKVHVSFVQPEWYLGGSNQYKIGYTPWESTEIPESWIHYMQEQDEIWTTSNFCLEIGRAHV